MKFETSIRSRLVKGLMLVVLFFLVQAGLVWYAVDSARSTVVESTRKNTVATSELNALALHAQQIRRYEKEYFVYVADKEKRASYEREWRQALGEIEAMLAKMKNGSDGAFSEADIEKVALWTAASAFYAQEMEKIFSAVAARSASAPANLETHAAAVQGVYAYTPVEVNGMIKAGKERFSTDLIKGVAAMSKVKTADTLDLAKIANNTFSNLMTGVMVTVSIGVFVALMLSFNLPRMVTNSINGLSVAAEEMSMGNLNREYDAGGVAEFKKLAEALNRMRLGQLALVERLKARR